MERSNKLYILPIKNNKDFLYLDNVKNENKDEILVVAMEECAELQQALSKEIRNIGDTNNICEEIADVIICIDKLIEKLDLDVKLIEDWKYKKIARQEIKIMQ